VAGQDSLSGLATAVQMLKNDDPFALVFVVAPSREAALSIRRVMATSAGSGFVNITFGTSTQLASELAEAAGALRSRQRLDPALKRAFIATAAKQAFESLIGSGNSGSDGVLPDIFTNRRTLEALVDSFVRLDETCDVAEVEQALTNDQDGIFPRESRLVLRSYVDFKRSYSRSYFDDQDLFVCATQAVSEGALEEIPSVVVYLPMSLTLREERLFAALGSVGIVEVVAGYTGDEVADEYLETLLGRIEALVADREILEPTSAKLHSTERPSPAICTALDAEEEVRTAVRTVQSWCFEGEEVASTAVAYAATRPYQDLVSEYMDEAGVEFWGSRRRKLSDTAPGGVLRGILRVVESDFRRDAVVSLAHAIPPAGRHFELDGQICLVTPEVWDGLSREAGIAAGAEDWTTRMTALGEEIEQKTEKSAAVDACKSASAFVELLTRSIPVSIGRVGDTETLDSDNARSSASWSELSTALIRLLDVFVGPVFRRRDPGDREDFDRVAFERIVSALEALSKLDSLGKPTALADFIFEVQAILDGSAPGGKRPKGLLVGPVNNLAGAPIDSVFVVGATEGNLPAPPLEDSLLKPLATALGRPELASRGPSAQEQRLRLYTLLKSACRSVLAHPIADIRQRRTAQASWWLLEEATLRRRSSVSSSTSEHTEPTQGLLSHEDLASSRCGDWHIYVPSLEQGVGSLFAAEEQEANLARIFDELAEGISFADSTVVRESPLLSRRVVRAGALASPHTDEWWGSIELPDRFTEGLRVSPTDLEHWSDCPYRYFLRSVLRLREVERPEELSETSARDLGSAVHEVLQRLFEEERADEENQLTESLEPESVDRLQMRQRRLRELIEEVFSSWLETGRLPGDRSLLDLQKPKVLRALDQALYAEEALEKGFELTPWLFEHDLDESVSLDEASSELRVKGKADRIDLAAGGQALAVIDYKTGRLTDERRREIEKRLPLVIDISDPYEARRYLEDGLAGVRGSESSALERAPVSKLMAGGTFLQLPLYMLASSRLVSHENGDFMGLIWQIDIASGRNAVFGATVARLELAEITSFLSRIVRLVKSGIFVPNPGQRGFRSAGERCRNCEFDDVCPRDRSEICAQKSDDEAYAKFFSIVTEGDGS
jgi:ATP-dependent helicase/nuclease subunit B